MFDILEKGIHDLPEIIYKIMFVGWEDILGNKSLLCREKNLSSDSTKH